MLLDAPTSRTHTPAGCRTLQDYDTLHALHADSWLALHHSTHNIIRLASKRKQSHSKGWGTGGGIILSERRVWTDGRLLIRENFFSETHILYYPVHNIRKINKWHTNHRQASAKRAPHTAMKALLLGTWMKIQDRWRCSRLKNKTPARFEPSRGCATYMMDWNAPKAR